MCENLVYVATTIGQLQHTEYLKPTFLDTFKWAIRPVFPETVTIVLQGEKWLELKWLSARLFIGQVILKIGLRLQSFIGEK